MAIQMQSGSGEEAEMDQSGARRVVEILLVEDNPGDVQLAREAFRECREPPSLSVVGNGEEALVFLRREGAHQSAPRPDLILLDLNLPRKSGRELLRDIKGDAGLARIPVVVLTTSQAEDDVAGAYDLNANCYITKPMDLGEFFEVARSIEQFWLQTVRLPSRP